jgi:hypothetical protein
MEGCTATTRNDSYRSAVAMERVATRWLTARVFSVRPLAVRFGMVTHDHVEQKQQQQPE